MLASDEWDVPSKRKLVEALIACNCMQTPQSREQIIADLRTAIGQRIKHSPATKQHVDSTDWHKSKRRTGRLVSAIDNVRNATWREHDNDRIAIGRDQWAKECRLGCQTRKAKIDYQRLGQLKRLCRRLHGLTNDLIGNGRARNHLAGR